MTFHPQYLPQDIECRRSLIVTEEAGEQGAGEKDTEIPLQKGFQAPKFIYAQKQKYLFRDA